MKLMGLKALGERPELCAARPERRWADYGGAQRAGPSASGRGVLSSELMVFESSSLSSGCGSVKKLEEPRSPLTYPGRIRAGAFFAPAPYARGNQEE